MCFINEQSCNTQLLKENARVRFQRICDSFAQRLIHILCLAAQFACNLSGIFQKFFDLISGFFQFLDVMILREANLLKAAICHNDAVVILIPDLLQNLFPFRRNKAFGIYTQHIGAGVKLPENIPPLTYQVVGNNIQILFRKAHAPQLHSGCDHNKGFSGTYIVGQQRVGRKEDSRHRILLIGIQFDCRRHCGKGQERTIKMAFANTAKVVLKNHLQLCFSLRIFPYPFLECFNQLFLLFQHRYSFRLVDHSLFSGFVGIAYHLVRNAHSLHIQCALQNIQRRQPLCTVSGFCRHPVVV